jgi:uncharacterized repeat protein (TIGR01451 family)
LRFRLGAQFRRPLQRGLHFELKTFVTQAETHGGGWVPIVLHDICNQCADSSVSLANFTAFLDWLQPRAMTGTVVKTVREVISPAPSADVSLTKSGSPDPVTAGGSVTYTIKAHNAGPNPASGVTVADSLPSGLTLVSASTTKGTCSGTTTVTCNIGTLDAGAANDVTVTIVATAGWAAVPSVSNTATASSSTADPSTSNNQASAQTTVNPAYPHPRGASPIRVSLVPAFAACDATGSNSTHGAPLEFASCAPPRPASTELTIGTPDANGSGANFMGSAAIGVVVGSPGTPPDEADVTLDFSLTDVRNADDLSDYAGELNARAAIRLTDRRNGPSGSETGTAGDFDLNVAVPCATTPAAGTGATCFVSTTADAVTPGMVVESARAIWEIANVVVDDGGPDGVASTHDNSPFAVQGVFVP